MTIRNSIDAQALSRAYDDFERCAEEAPDGAYEEAKAVKALIGGLADRLIQDVRALGLKADNCDSIREVEAVIYGYLKASNPEATVFAVSEGFGHWLDTPARERVLSNCQRDMAALRTLGVIPAAASL